MLEKIKGLFQRDDRETSGGGAPEAVGAPSARLVDTVRVFRVESPETEERVLAYVHAGTGPEIVAELAARPRPDLDALLGRPGSLQRWKHVTPQQADALKAAAPGWTTGKATTARRNLYTLSDGVRVEQLVRLARVLHAVAPEVDRSSDEGPGWFTLLVDDVVTTGERSFRRGRGKDARPEPWSAATLAAIAREGGVPDDAVAACVLRGVLERTVVPSYYQDPLGVLLDLPGVPDLLVAEPGAATATVPSLSAPGRVAFCDLAADHAPVREALAGLLARLAADPAKSVRERALAVVALLPAESQVALLEPWLLATPVARSANLVTHLVGAEGGVAAVERALDAVRDDRRQGARAAQLEGALGRARALEGAADAVERVATPPFAPLPEVELGEDVERAVREVLDGLTARARTVLDEVARAPKDDHRQWRKEAAQRDVKELTAITDARLRDALAHLSGRGTRPDPATLRRLASPAVVSRLPGLTLLHHVRLSTGERYGRNAFPWWSLRARTDLGVDLRVLADALERSGVADVEDAVDDLALTAWWAADTLAPEHTWAWYAEHQERLERRLGLRPGYTGNDATARVLDVLTGFPEIPAAFLPRLSELALGQGRTHRATAQRILARHAGARRLAEEGLRSGTAEVRVTAAEWLQRLGDPEAVPALRGLLATERREVVRAAVLTALESLGEDIAADLAPDVLETEARKGLRAKPPASLAWFDLDALPAVRWAADGAVVPAEVVRWWTVLAVKLKDPSGLGLLARYVGLLDAEGRAALGRHVLAAWVAQDTRNPAPDESRSYAETEAQQRHDRYQEWYRRYPQHYEAEAARTVDDHYRDAYREHQATYLGSAIKDKGMLALTVAMPGAELADTFTRYAKAHFARRAQIEALVHALAANAEPAAVQALLGVSRRFRQATVQETARRLATELAERRGWSADQLADRTVQTAGFEDDGLLHLDLGAREYVGRITPAFTLELTNDAGKVVKALPAPRAGEDPEVVKAARSQLGASRKELKAVVTLQTQRLYEAMCVGRTWQADEWTEFVLGHPVMARLAAGLVWVENPGEGQRAFRPGDDGALIDVEDEDVVLGAGSVVGVAHAVTLGEDATAAWREHLADYEVRPLFDQLGVSLPALPAGAREIADHQGWFSDSFSIRGRATKRGYARSQAEDAGWFSAYTKAYASIGVLVEIEFTGAFLPEENIAAAVTRLVFRRTDRTFGDLGELAVADVPPALVAESYRDYVHVAEAGAFEPDWERKSQW